MIFISQPVYNKECLIRLRYSATTGKLIKEEIAVGSKSFENATYTTVLKNKTSDGYAVVCYRKIYHFPGEKIQVVRFGSKDDTLNISSLDVKEGAFKYISYVDAFIDDKDNIGFSLSVTNVEVSGTTMLSSDLDTRFVLCYLPAGSTDMMVTMTQIPQRLSPNYIKLTNNPFTGNINCLFVNSLSESVRNGIERKLVMGSIPCFLVCDASNLNILSQNIIENNKIYSADSVLRDSMLKFKRPPLYMYTDRRGVTTMISEEQKMFTTKENGLFWGNTRLGDIYITQLNDDGEEIWGKVISKTQFVHNYLGTYELAHRKEIKFLFRDHSEDEFNNQLTSLISYLHDDAQYILFNDTKHDFSQPDQQPADSIYNYTYTNGIYYKIDKSRTITKSYLFGEPAPDETRAALIESSDYLEEKNLYTSLLLATKGSTTTTRLGWATLK